MRPEVRIVNIGAKILIVDDDEVVRFSLKRILEQNNYEVTSVGCVAEALTEISRTKFDVLVSDLHMPGPGDGLTVIGAMRHANPLTLTILMSAFPDLVSAANAITLEPHEILIKPANATALIELISLRLAGAPPSVREIETIATVLERTIPTTVDDWFRRVELEDKLNHVSMAREIRVAYVPRILLDLVERLRSFAPLGSNNSPSSAAREHGQLRRQQGYSAAMMVQESRMLQVSIFQTLQNNLLLLDFSILLDGVMTIADEVDYQLSQAMESYIAESSVDSLPN
jgi:ActR/RegA family two-component response regulator